MTKFPKCSILKISQLRVAQGTLIYCLPRFTNDQQYVSFTLSLTAVFLLQARNFTLINLQ